MEIASSECPIVVSKIFRCLVCQKYVATPSQVSAAKYSAPATDIPILNSEVIDQSDLTHQPLPSDPFPLQNLDHLDLNLDHLDLIPITSTLNLPSSVSFPQSQVTFLQDPVHESYNFLDQPCLEGDETTLLRMEIEQLRDAVETLKQRCAESMLSFLG